MSKDSDKRKHYWYIGIASAVGLAIIDAVAGTLSDHDLFYFLGGVTALSVIPWIIVGYGKIQAAYICLAILFVLVATSRLSIIG